METNNKANFNWYPGHMAKTRRQIENDLKIIDVVIELLDARIPMASRNPDIKKLTQNKRRIILLNKCDLADEVSNSKWVSKLSKEAPTILTDSNSGKGIDKVTKKVEELMQEDLAIQAARGRKNKTIRVMILGIPNVGKSSFINRIAKKNTAEVGNRPGVTRQKQWIRIGKNQELLDTPGVLWPKFESEEVALNLAYTGTIKDDLIERYKLNDSDLNDIENSSNPMYTLMQIIGQKRGALISGGNTDDEKVARIILDDFRSGKLGRITLEQL